MALVAASALAGFSGLSPLHGIPLVPWLWGGGVLLLAAWGGGPVVRRVMVLALATLGPLALSLLVVHGFFNPSAPTVLGTWGPLTLRAEGLQYAAHLLARIVPPVLATLLLLITTEPSDLALGLTELGLPRELAYVVLGALFLLPQMLDRARRIQQAQQARGLPVGGSLWARVRAGPPLLGPLLGSALQEAEGRALTLELRAFRAPGPKSHWRRLDDSGAQRALRWGLLLTGTGLFVGGLLSRIA